TMATCASPPDIQPTATIDTLSRRAVMPLSFIRCPARTKNGTASNGKLWLIDAIFCTPIDIGMPDSVMKNRKPAMPVAKATGMPIAMRTTKTIPTSSISELQHFGIFLLCGRSGVDEELVALTAPGLGHVVGNRSGKQRAA